MLSDKDERKLLPKPNWQCERELLPKSYWIYMFHPLDGLRDHEQIIIGCYERGNGAVRSLDYEVFRLSDLPNDFVGAPDLEFILANIGDRRTVREFERLTDGGLAPVPVGSDLV